VGRGEAAPALRRGALVAAVVAMACGRPAGEERTPGAARWPPAATAALERGDAGAPAVVAAERAAPIAREPQIAVRDTGALAIVAARGGALADLIGERGVADLAATIEREVAAVAAGDRLAGVGVRRHLHRLFDVAWLATDAARYELVGVVARLDRIPASPDACGDVRLIYRLGYQRQVAGQPVASRLPLTLAVILAGEPVAAAAGCQAAAARWMQPVGLAGAPLGAALLGDDGPLGGGRLAAARVSQVLVNLQAVRWPSAVKPDLGGHAEYVLFAMTPKDGGLGLGQLSMTPDVEAILARPELRATLLAWLRQPATLDALELGHGELPAELLATRAIAVSPGGLGRRANRPFRRLLEPAELAALPLAGRPRIGSPEALLRRLDELSCGGCHQARTLAGFHWLGDDPAEVPPGNALAVSRSPHMLAEEGRRAAVVRALAAGEPVDFARPLAERDDGVAGQLGDHCGLGDDPGFAAWSCRDGLRCAPLDAPRGDPVGFCVATPAAIGDSCDVGPLVSRGDPRRDRMVGAERRRCVDGGRCAPRKQGFPSGSCLRSGCDAMPDGAACGVIASHGFDRCMVRHPFPRCLRDHVAEVGLAACDETRSCRDDYLCGRMPGGVGACIPPYFLFQLRVDGH
jgi:hypothetical protein